MVHSRYLDNAAFIKAKINNAGVVALGWSSILFLGGHSHVA